MPNTPYTGPSISALIDKFPSKPRSAELAEKQRKAVTLVTRLHSLSERFTANLLAGESPVEPQHVKEARAAIEQWQRAQLNALHIIMANATDAINSGNFAAVDTAFQTIIRDGGLNE